MWVYFFMLVGHFIGDFVLQTRHMAKKKSSSNYYLTMHVFVYSLANIILWLIFLPLFGVTYDKFTIMTSLLVIFITHWLTDYFTSKQTGKYYLEGEAGEKKFFTMIGFDQTLHFLQLFATYEYIILQK